MKQSAQRNRKGGQSDELADFARNFVGTPLSGLEFRSNGLDVNLNSDWDRSNIATTHRQATCGQAGALPTASRRHSRQTVCATKRAHGRPRPSRYPRHRRFGPVFLGPAFGADFFFATALRFATG